VLSMTGLVRLALIATGPVDALITDIAGAARISRVSQHAITGRHPRNTDRDSRCRRRSKTSSTPAVRRDGETPRRGPAQPEQARSTTSVQDRGRWPDTDPSPKPSTDTMSASTYWVGGRPSQEVWTLAVDLRSGGIAPDAVGDALLGRLATAELHNDRPDSSPPVPAARLAARTHRYAPHSSPHPPGSSWLTMKRRDNTGSLRIPPRLAHQTRPIRQC
jgi:hypothetical protein